MKKLFLVAFLVISTTVSNNIFAQLPKSYNFQPQVTPIYVVDGIVTNKAYLDKLNPNQIEFMSVLKGKQATDKYGDKAVNGVIEITTKKDNAINDNNIKATSTPQPIYIVNGEEIDSFQLENIKPDDILTIPRFFLKL